MAFAKEGADGAIAYLSEQEDEDAARTTELVGQAGRRCVTIRSHRRKNAARLMHENDPAAAGQ